MENHCLLLLLLQYVTLVLQKTAYLTAEVWSYSEM